MSQDLLMLPSSKKRCALAKCPQDMDFIRFFYIGFRFLRYKFHPWITLAIAPINVLATPGMKCADAKVCCMKAASKINFVGVYEFINDLLW